MVPASSLRPPKDYYADSVVIAYRVPDAEISSSPVEPKVTSSSGHVDPAILAARDMMKSTDLPIAPVGQKSWIQFEYPEPHTIDAVTHNPYKANSPLLPSGLLGAVQVIRVSSQQP